MKRMSGCECKPDAKRERDSAKRQARAQPSRRWLGAVILIGTLSMSAFAAGKGPEIQMIDGKVSITADAIPLGRLLRLLDQATGMKSKVPAELANRNISARFSGLRFDDAVRKIFEGQPFDYVFIAGQGVIVTAASQSLSASGPSGPTPAFSQMPQPTEQPFVEDSQPFFPPPPPQPGVAVGQPNPGGVPVFGNNPFNQQPFNQQQQQQPAMIQTPFGPIPNPRANQGGQPNGNAPLIAPGQQMPFGQTPYGNPNPFGSAGSPSASPGQTDMFGNTSPALFNGNPPGTAPGQQNPLLPRKP